MSAARNRCNGFIVLLAWIVVAVASVAYTNVFSQRSVPTNAGGEANDVRGPNLDAPHSSVRVLTYNIQWGMGADGVRDLDRVVAQLRRIDADIALLSEVDVNWRRSGNVNQPNYISEQADFPYHYYGVALNTWASGNTRSSQYGNLLLSRFPIVSARTVPLPTPVGRESRSAIVAEIDVDGVPWIVIGTHLGLNGAERLQQVTRLRELAAEATRTAAATTYGNGIVPRPPVIIMGDFNARPDAPELKRLLDHDDEPTVHLIDTYAVAGTEAGYTFPFPDPYARIDYVFVSRSLADAVVNAQALPWPGSDHLPVTVDIARP